MSPANAAQLIIFIGFIFTNFVPTNVATKMAMLTQKCHGLIAGDEKFSGVISRRAAAAMSPTTAGRRPDMIFCTVGVFMYFINTRQMRIISMNDGSTRAHVAVALPKMDAHSPMPALCMAVYPQYVAALILIGPGVIWLIATMFVNSGAVSHAWLYTVWFCMSDNIP